MTAGRRPICELLVRVIDKINDDPYHDAQCTKRGDVIVAMPDGWEWGRAEISDPQYTIVKLPGVSLEVGESFLGREFNTDPANPSAVLQRRAFRLDIDALQKKLGRLTDADLLKFKQRKPALDDPNVFGAD